MTDEALPRLPIEDEAWGGVNELSSLRHESDDRKHVLSLAAFAEDALELFLVALLIPSAATTRLLYGFDAPLTGH